LLIAIALGQGLLYTVLAQVPTPRSVLGFEPAADRTIADWGQITGYFARLDRASDRVVVKEIGKSTAGRPLVVAFISSAANVRDLEKYRSISAQLADPRAVLDDATRERLIRSGKTIVSISCSIHSEEIVGSQMSMRLAYDLATANDGETKEVLDNTILLLIPSPNPDGIDIVADWYRKTLGTRSEGTSPPTLYHPYAGHDNNRDWFMLNLAETRAVTKLYWREWFPQIVYDIHQMGRNGARFVIPPFVDPPNTRLTGSQLREVGLIGYKIAADLEAKNLKGVATNATFDTWWHGGFRTAPYYHNSVGILSEAASADLLTPVTITRDQLAKFTADRGFASPLERTTAYPTPWEGGIWRGLDISAMELSASRSLLSIAAKYRESFLRNFYERGRASLAADASVPEAYIVLAGQPNTDAVARFLEILLAQGIEVYEMTRELHVIHERGRSDYHEAPGGSFIIFTRQPQRNNILSLFERQLYPHRLNAAGEAERPYDVAGWTLPLQMDIDHMAAWSIRDLENERPRLRRITSIDEARKRLDLPVGGEPFARVPNPLRTAPKIAVYRGSVPSADEGWTRFVFDTFSIPFTSVSDADVRNGRLNTDVVVLASDSEKNLVEGLSAERYPADVAGGLGDQGVANLKRYVESGGKLICFDASCRMLIKRFGLPVRNVLEGFKRSEFYNPGSIVSLQVDQRHPLARGMKSDVPAYFINSSAFEIAADAQAAIVARYAEKDALLSGWMLGENHLNGKAALVELPLGKGTIVMFAFRPQHRGQSWGTFRFLFNALER
jgi:hypothetical protein